jgi:DNA-binding transcriptional regulator YiaG
MAKNFKSLRAKRSPEPRARREAKAQRMIQEMALDKLRAARALTQEHLATILGIKQSVVSKLERRAVFLDGAMRITQFHSLAAGQSERSARATEVGGEPAPVQKP